MDDQYFLSSLKEVSRFLPPLTLSLVAGSKSKQSLKFRPNEEQKSKEQTSAAQEDDDDDELDGDCKCPITHRSPGHARVESFLEDFLRQ